MRGRMGGIRIDDGGHILALSLWVIAVVVTFVHHSDRFQRNNASKPNLRAAVYTLIWSVPFTIAAVLIAVLLDLLMFGL